MLRLPVLLGVLGLLGSCANAASAAPITFGYAGRVDSVGAYDPAFISDPLNTTFSGEFTFDSTAPDLIPGSVSGSYQGSNLTLSLVGVPLAFSSVSIGVTNPSAPAFDQYLVGYFDAVTSLSIRLEDFQRTAFSSDALPTAPPALAMFENRFIFFQLNDANDLPLVDFNGTITSLQCLVGCDAEPVPESATLLLVSTGAAALVARRRRARRS